MGKGGQEAGTPAKATPMTEAWALWNGGDKVQARRAAEAVLAGTPSPELAADARDLLSRLSPPWQVWAYGGFAAAVILGLILLAALRT